MDIVLQARFQRIDSVLTLLVDSISSYSPSPQAALDLVAADDELAAGLEQRMFTMSLVQQHECGQPDPRQVATHQAHHAYIQNLRAAVNTLENQVCSSVEAVVALRRELRDTGTAAEFQAHAKTHSRQDVRSIDKASLFPVATEELLGYARHISYFSTRPGGHSEDNAHQLPRQLSPRQPDSAVVNGLQSPVALPAHPSTTNTAVHPDPVDPAGQTQCKAWCTLQPHQQDFLNANMPLEMARAWAPWPSAEKIRAGSLAEVQRMTARGEDLDASHTLAAPGSDSAEKQMEHQSCMDVEMGVQRQQRKSEEASMPRRAAPPVSAGQQHAPREPAVFAGFDVDDSE